jgi:hypothetical protein
MRYIRGLGVEWEVLMFDQKILELLGAEDDSKEALCYFVGKVLLSRNHRFWMPSRKFWY